MQTIFPLTASYNKKEIIFSALNSVKEAVNWVVSKT
jgi:hypothetical protein